MGSATATDAGKAKVTRFDKIRHWITPFRLHCAVLAVYVILVATVMCFHEPWFDEAQAWLIARDCSWREMILERPHYEGHPPLWWMILAIPAKLGVPYEIGLKSVNLVFATLMIWLLEFKTKLPELFKAILPFSYFLCYQYGVTSRPYALMICAMLLIAINWKNRDEKPLPVILSMMLLCLTSSYGIVISGMLAVNWVFRFLKSDHSLIRNKRRFFALLALLAFAVILIIDVIPAKDVFHSNFDVQGTEEPVPVWQRFLNAWILLPSETLFTSILTNSSFNFVTLSWDQVLEAGLFSGLMWAFLIQISRRRSNATLLLTTYLAMSIVFTQHFTTHHDGIILGFFIAILAIDCETRPISADDWPKWCLTLADWLIGQLGGRTSLRYFNLMKALGMLLMLIGVYWTASASICDIRYDYAPSRAMANYVKTYHLDKYRWMSGWTRLIKMSDTTPSVAKLIDKGGYCAGGDNCIDYTSWLQRTQVEMAPYFKHNLAANAYQGHSFASWDWIEHPYESKKDLATWRSWGEPEFYDTIYQPFYFSDLGYDRNDYTKVRVVNLVTPWKDQRTTGSYDIYVRNDIYKNVMHSPDTGITWPDGSKRK